MDISAFQKLSAITGEDDEDTLLLREMADEAIDYLDNLPGCPPVKNGYLAYGVGGVFALFLIELIRNIEQDASKIWVVTGDVPSAYLVIAPDDSSKKAIERYCDLMQDWATAVKTAQPLENVYPVAAAPTLENATMLEDRITFLKKEILPDL